MTRTIPDGPAGAVRSDEEDVWGSLDTALLNAGFMFSEKALDLKTVLIIILRTMQLLQRFGEE
ncbi:MAG: hypothetical protein HND58_06440 [Planctomycetota bacterium]|nr:MAG: hypothetical protein HND58_06440 [Planctomycetota bacterium]